MYLYILFIRMLMFTWICAMIRCVSAHLVFEQQTDHFEFDDVVVESPWSSPRATATPRAAAGGGGGAPASGGGGGAPALTPPPPPRFGASMSTSSYGGASLSAEDELAALTEVGGARAHGSG